MPAKPSTSERRTPCGTIHVYIVENNRLAAQCLYMLLNECSIIHTQIVEDITLDETVPLQTSSCFVVIDQSSLSHDWCSYGHRLRARFPRSRLILVGSQEAGNLFRGVFFDWIADVIEYDDVKRLSASVLAADARPGKAELTAQAASFAQGTRCPKHMRLSKRESEIVELVRLQLSNKEIANRLNIAEVTVKFHISNAFAKMGLRRRRELQLLNMNSDGHR
jgi:DNA-binding NarL/FixJ family response regulator